MKICSSCNLADTVPAMNPIQSYSNADNKVALFHKICGEARGLSLVSQSATNPSLNSTPTTQHLEDIAQAKAAGCVDPKAIFGTQS